MKRCELCKSIATIYCESDQASLCWSCDAKVHSANFLVSRHSRCLLCQSCQSPTRWSASGGKLERSTVSICDRCVVNGTFDDDGTGTDDEYDGDEDETDLDGKEVRDYHQEVPWSSPPPPSASSSSGNDEFLIADRGVSMKRRRQNVANLSFQINDRKKLKGNGNGIMISGGSKPATVVGKSKATRAVGFDLNLNLSLSL